MEISELTTDESLAAHPHQIFLPGCFVVLQGIAGDGLANTIETSPDYAASTEEDDDEDEAMEETRGGAEGARVAPPLEEDHFAANRVAPASAPAVRALSASLHPGSATASTPSVLLSRMVTSNQNPTCVLNIPAGVQPNVRLGPRAPATSGRQAASAAAAAAGTGAATTAVAATTQGLMRSASQSPPDDSFVVVGSESSTPPAQAARIFAAPQPAAPAAAAGPNTTTTTTTSTPSDTATRREERRKHSAIQKWKAETKTRHMQQRQEWQLQQHQHHQQHLQQQQQQQSRQSLTSTTSTPAPESAWWLDPETGYLAIFESLPQQQQSPSTQQSSIIGTLAPGSTVTALKLYTLDSETLQIIHIDEERGDDSDTKSTHQPPLPPSLGVVQVLEIQIASSSSSSSSSNSPESSTTSSGGGDIIAAAQSPTTTKIGFAVYSVHGYAFLVPGIPTLYMDPQVWWWRVTCKVGAFLRQGLELSSDHHCTIPYGSFVQVTRKTVNRMGLSRLRVVAKDSTNGQRIEGWCSEFLNPLSGQRGHVVQPLPLVVPAVYRVTLPEGAVIREQVELSSRQIGHAPCGTLLTIVQRRFSEHPQDQCVERLKLAGGEDSGWISVRLNQLPPEDKCVVELVGADTRFDPANPGEFHWRVWDEEQIRQQEQGGGNVAAAASSSSSNNNNGGDISSIEEGSSSLDDVKPKAKPKAGAGGNKRKQQVDNCLICLTEERNSTIVHGETGHIACCLVCARILKARGDRCPVCRLEIDAVIQHFWA